MIVSSSTVDSMLTRGDAAFDPGLLDRLPYPVLLIGDDFEVIFENQEARRAYGEARTCYELLHDGHEPCTTDPDLCPKLVAQKTGKLTTAHHVHRINGVKQAILECAIPLKTGEVLAIDLPIDVEPSAVIRHSAWWAIGLAVFGLAFLLPGFFVGTVGGFNALVAVTLGALGLAVGLDARQATSRGLGPARGRLLCLVGIALSAVTLVSGLALGGAVLAFLLQSG